MTFEGRATTSLAFVTHEGDLAVAAWDSAANAAECSSVLLRTHPALAAETGVAPLALTAPTWSPNGRRIAVSVRYPPSANAPGSALAIVDLEGRDPPRIVWRSAPGETGMIAPGLPHYLNWSPDGEHLALLAVTSGGMTLFVLDRRAGRAPVPVADGAPIFFAWSARGDALLVHHGPHLSLLHLDNLARPKPLLSGGLGCQLPVWAPDAERFAFVRLHRGSQSLAIMAGDGSERAVAGLPRGSCALAWRPAHHDIAFSIRGASDSGHSDGLWLVRIGSGEPVRLLSGDVGAFLWAPDGSSIVFLAPAPVPGQSSWCVLDVRTHATSYFAPFYEAPELALQLAFFEQCAVSHRIWSADSAALALNGRVPANGTPPTVASNSIYIQPIQREVHPHFVASGTFPSWRPA